MDAHELNGRLKPKATHVANYLNPLTPYERALVLHQAEIIWAERRRGGPDPAEQESDARLLTGQWLANMVQRLSLDDLDQLIDMAQRLDEGASRFSRLTEELDISARHVSPYIVPHAKWQG